MIDITKPLQTRDGRAIKFLHKLNSTTTDFPLVVLLTDSDGEESIQVYTVEGQFYRGVYDPLDLVHPPQYEYKLLYIDGIVVPDGEYNWEKSKDDFARYDDEDRLGWLVRREDQPKVVSFEAI